ncbi:hypothetical protein [Nocardioides limicola]|uniref:hypothetical protein n=1 Tax=Nocardioides limicola TaxID=2803368 RepID=UPI00193C64CD|nr:hypothetical protein [Nocardioides sp. DJM-14]
MRARRPVWAIVLTALAGLLVACGGTPEPVPIPPRPTEAVTLAPLPAAQAPTDPRQALALVPADAETVTITNWLAIRQAAGHDGLTSEDLMVDRRDFWDKAASTSVLLTDGLLVEENSLFMLDYDFTQEDVDFEVRFRGPSGNGYILGFRSTLDMARVERAVQDRAGRLRGAEVWPDQFLAVKNVAEQGEPTWAADSDLIDLTSAQAESTYLHRGCLAFTEALGVDATYDDAEPILNGYDFEHQLRPLTAFSVSFSGDVATGRLGRDREDLAVRTELIDVWPRTSPVHLDDAFTGMPLFDPGSGRIGLTINNMRAAATLTLTHQLPFAICRGTPVVEEPE